MRLKGADLPLFALKTPVLLIDSGQSVDESVFLEHYRHFLWHLHEERSYCNVRHVWMLYPNERHPERYGSCPVNQYDKWEIRPIRRNHKPLYSGGIMHTVASFEDGCMRLGIKAPWREHNKKGRRATSIYLNPTSKDVRFIQRGWRKFKQHYNIPDLYIGQPSGGKLPRDVMAWGDGIFCYDKVAQKNIKQAVTDWGVNLMDYGRMWEPEGFGHELTIATNWGHDMRQRQPDICRKWFEDWGFRVHVPQGNRWQDMMDAARSKYYVVMSRRETVPFDAKIAISCGSTLIAPDIPLYRRLPGKNKILYPARDCGRGEVAFSTTDVRFWLHNKFRK